MHDRKHVLANLDLVKAKTAARKVEFDFDAVEQLAADRRRAIGDFESLRAEQKRASESMKTLTPGSDEFIGRRGELKEMSQRAKQLEEQKKSVEAELDGVLLTLPNLIDDVVPVGDTEEDNVLLRNVGTPPNFDFDVADHVALGEKLGILDQESAGRVAGARFAFLIGAGARLERALTSFMLDLHTREHGYVEMLPPFLVNADAMIGTGQLPKFEADLFRAGPFYLIPTAEVPVTNYYRDQLLPELTETKNYCAYTPCFRSEAGSHGKDTRGLIRQHQFDKVELVKFTRPEESDAEHELLTSHACTVLDQLELPYRVVELCSADVGFGAARCFDIEVWIPSQERYREISSCSNYRAFQARRAGIRFRDEDGRPQFMHTLNGSALAVGRTWLAILENFQQADGSVTIPDVLRPYMGVDRIARSD